MLKLLNSTCPQEIWSKDLNDLFPCIALKWQLKQTESRSWNMSTCLLVWSMFMTLCIYSMPVRGCDSAEWGPTQLIQSLNTAPFSKSSTPPPPECRTDEDRPLIPSMLFQYLKQAGLLTAAHSTCRGATCTHCAYLTTTKCQTVCKGEQLGKCSGEVGSLWGVSIVSTAWE